MNPHFKNMTFIVNGVTTTITTITFDPQHNIRTIDVQLRNNCTKMILKKCTFDHKYIYDGYYYKTSFPIALAYTMTSHTNHRVQQLPQKFLLTQKKVFALGLTSVLFSRVINWNELENNWNSSVNWLYLQFLWWLKLA